MCVAETTNVKGYTVEKSLPVDLYTFHLILAQKPRTSHLKQWAWWSASGAEALCPSPPQPLCSPEGDTVLLLSVIRRESLEWVRYPDTGNGLSKATIHARDP